MEPILLEVAPGITAIDTVYGGRERYTAAYLIAAREPCLVETGPTTSLGHVVDGLTRLGITPADLAHVVVTHIVVLVVRVTISYRTIELGLPAIWLGAISASFAILPIFTALQIGRWRRQAGARTWSSSISSPSGRSWTRKGV